MPLPVNLGFECRGVIDPRGRLAGAGWAPVIVTGMNADFEMDWPIPTELMSQLGRGGGPLIVRESCNFTSYPRAVDELFTITAD
jgi:hypothetical protein